MSKHFFLSLLAALCFLQACRETKVADSSSFEAVATVSVSHSTLRGGIDWNLEFALLESDMVLAKAASRAGTDPETLDQSTRVEAELESRKIRITGRHEDEETAQKYADALAAAFEEVRSEREKEIQAGEIDRLKKAGEELTNLLEVGSMNDLDEKPDLLNPDLMTYEKARKALEENPIPDDGVLYRKEEKE